MQRLGDHHLPSLYPQQQAGLYYGGGQNQQPQGFVPVNNPNPAQRGSVLNPGVVGILSQEQVKFINDQHVSGASTTFNLGGQQQTKVPKYPEANPGSLEVDTYQIAVPNGDCSIHLLVQRGKGNGPKGTIVRSVLMDGGNDGAGGGKMAAVILKNMIQRIRAQYSYLGNTCPVHIEFDSWVITHWDNDHYAGALQMIQNDFATGQNGGKSSYMKYDWKPTGWVPLTNLYCPSWRTLPIFLDRRAKEIKSDPKLLKKKPKDLELLDPQNEPLGQGVVRLLSGGNVICPRLCNGLWDHRNLLAVDFFTGDRCVNIFHQQLYDKSFENAFSSVLNSFNAVRELTTWIYGDSPRFLCIGAGGFLLGSQVSDENLKIALASRKATPEDTWANLSSIISVLYFPNSEARQMSLYWGGDSVSVMEAALAESKFLSGYTCKVAKWSHHGGRHSSPEVLWAALQPERVVVSANRTGRYLHPHPETIQRFRQYLNYKNYPFYGDRIFSTFYPGWILNPTPNAVTKLGGQKSIDQLKATWLGLSPVQKDCLGGIVHFWQATGNNNQQWAYVESNNGYMDTTGQSMGQYGEVKVMKKLQRTTPFQIHFIHVLSSAQHARDGQVSLYAQKTQGNTGDRQLFLPVMRNANRKKETQQWEEDFEAASYADLLRDVDWTWFTKQLAENEEEDGGEYFDTSLLEDIDWQEFEGVDGEEGRGVEKFEDIGPDTGTGIGGNHGYGGYGHQQPVLEDNFIPGVPDTSLLDGQNFDAYHGGMDDLDGHDDDGADGNNRGLPPGVNAGQQTVPGLFRGSKGIKKRGVADDDDGSKIKPGKGGNQKGKEKGGKNVKGGARKGQYHTDLAAGVAGGDGGNDSGNFQGGYGGYNNDGNYFQGGDGGNNDQGGDDDGGLFNWKF